MDFSVFLEKVTNKFPFETSLILGSATFSPESASVNKKNKESRAFDLVKDTDIVETVEFDRAVLGLNAYFDALNNKMDSWDINENLKQKINTWINQITPTEDDILAMSYAILFNDLGKIQKVEALYEKFFGQSCADHDALYVALLKECPEFFKGMETINIDIKQLLIEGLDSGFNLGKAVQLECPKNAWDSFSKVSEKARKFHMAHSFFDFLGVTGGFNPRQYSKNIINDNNVEAFLKVQTVSFEDYVLYRNNKVGAVDDDLALTRIACMCRVFNDNDFVYLKTAWDKIPMDDKFDLINLLESNDIFKEKPTELQYAPAILSNALKKDFEKAIVFLNLISKNVSLKIKDIDTKTSTNSNIITVNLVDVAKEFNATGEISEEVILESVDGGFLVKTRKNKINFSYK